MNCPNCHKEYTPVLDRKHPELNIQAEFPKAPAWQREQHITGICSDKCWDEFLGVSKYWGWWADTMRPVKGYTGPNTCLDGEDTHDWKDDTMREEGMDFKIRVCNKCNYWN